MCSCMKILCVCLVLVPCGLVAHDMSLHMYIGSQTFDVWQEFDPEFYDALVQAQTAIQYPPIVDTMLSLVKFYYMGLTLPDLLWPNGQSVSRGIIDELYPQAGNLCDPLKITSTTYNLVQTEIVFPDDNSHNLSYLYEMVEHARNNNWSPRRKALIYGAFMHVVQDLYVTFLQASRFGFGKCFDSDSALSQPILRYAETYHELFSPTQVDDWTVWDKFVGPLYGSLLYDDNYPPGTSVDYYEDACVLFRRINVITGQIEMTWQDTNFVEVQKFVDAANAVNWPIQNLTQERLESYLHGWAIFTFLIYGYTADDYQGTVGGIMAHPEWGFTYIREGFWWNIGSVYTPWRILWDLPAWLRNIILDLFATREIYKFRFLSFLSGNDPWHWYFQSVDRLDYMWENMVPDSLKTTGAIREYSRARRNLWYWQNTPGYHTTEPRLRNSYSEEPSIAVQFSDFYRQSVNQGPTLLDNQWNDLDVWTTARKAGLVGALYDVSSTIYPRQPGIIDLHYFKAANSQRQHVYDYIETEDTPNGGVEWDMIVFPPKLHIRLMGRKADGTIFQLGYPSQYQYVVYEPERKQAYLENNLDNAVNAGAEEVFWDILTFSTSGSSHLMLRSEYREAYQQSSMVYDNKTYQHWFNNGDPTRTSGQNPLAHPLAFWPSTVRLYRLNRPVNLTVTQIAPAQVKLQWTDRSNREAKFWIARKVDDGPWNEYYKEVGADITQYTDTISFHKYTYKIRAADGQGRFSAWSDEILFSGLLAQSDYSEMTAFNNQRKVVMGSDGKIHLVYYDGSAMYHAYSTDQGTSFADWFYLYVSDPVDTTPGFAIKIGDTDDQPHVVYGCNRQVSGDRRVQYFVLYIRDPLPYPDMYYNSDPTTISSRPFPPSIAFAGDSCYIAFMHYDGSIKIVGPEELGNPLFTIADQGYFPSIAYDPATKKPGRLVAAFHDIDWVLHIYYRYFKSGTWSHVELSDFNAFGSPSLCVWRDTVRVAVEGYSAASETYGIFTVDFVWDQGAGTYVPESVELISSNCDYHPDVIVGYSCLAAPDVVLWKYDDDIWYSTWTGRVWRNPVNVSCTNDRVSSYPQGVVFGSRPRKLLVVWTEEGEDEYWLVRKIISLPENPPPPDSRDGPQSTETAYKGLFSFDHLHPNPAAKDIVIRFTSPDQRKVTVKLYDVTGRLIDHVFSERARVGRNEIHLDSGNIAAGVYFMRLEAGDELIIEKVILLQ